MHGYVHSTWTDERLTMNGSEVNNGKCSSHIWTPDVVFETAKSSQIFGSTYLHITLDKVVNMAQRYSFKVGCLMYFEHYPFDRQNCVFSMALTDGIGRHHIIDWTLNAIKYVDTILELKLLPSTRDLFTNNASFIFQQDSASCHILNCQVIYSQFGLAIHQNDHQARRRFVEWAQNEIAAVPDFHKRILFSDEAHFWLNGYVNKQNCRIWSEANPQVYVETPLHPEKLTVWCALWSGGIIGPYFFKNDEGHNVTVNGDRYRAMITNFFIPELNNHDVQELWFQQDGATCHTARATIDLLKDTFGDRLISRLGPVNWPPRSCDLTPLDYFLWSYVKSLVYADKPQTLDHLEDNIHRVIADIRPQMLEKVIENWTSRLDYIRASRGSPMPKIIFKM
ncbi:DUF4817 domain-containing protein [Trichonephila clavipes]|nr:DUF4817 domain-containing protein [Trichonephila clavipes]